MNPHDPEYLHTIQGDTVPPRLPDLPVAELQEIKEVTCGSLSVIVDFNELYHDESEERAFELIGKLKDLLA
jgi:hypothetical protein